MSDARRLIRHVLLTMEAPPIIPELQQARIAFRDSIIRAVICIAANALLFWFALLYAFKIDDDGRSGIAAGSALPFTVGFAVWAMHGFWQSRSAWFEAHLWYRRVLAAALVLACWSPTIYLLFAVLRANLR